MTAFESHITESTEARRGPEVYFKGRLREVEMCQKYDTLGCLTVRHHADGMLTLARGMDG